MSAVLPSPAAFAALDDPSEAQAFSRRLDAQRWESWIVIEGMDCAACGHEIEDALSRVPGVLSAQVSVMTTRARVCWRDGGLRPSALFDTIAGMGYQPYPAGAAEQEHAARRGARMLLWRLLVAAFCMMQVMMYAAPEYLAAPGEITDDQRMLLRWAQWMLCIPLMLFAAWPVLRSAWRSLRARRVGMDVPASLGLLLAFGASTVATFDGTGEVWFDSVSMFVFFLLLSRWVEGWARRRATARLESLDRQLPAVAVRAGPTGFAPVPAAMLQVDDRIRVAPGEVLPADGVVIAGRSTVDESILSGESLPADKAVGATVVAGSRNLSSAIDVRVTQAPADSTVARVRRMVSDAAATRPDWARLADRWAAAFLACVLVLAAFAYGAWQWIDPTRALGVAIAVLIVTCPCALSLAAPAAMLAATAGLARRGVWLRNPAALERVLSVRRVAFDKTGTLTDATLRLADVTAYRDDVDAEAATAIAAALAAPSRHPVARALANAAAPVAEAWDWGEHVGEGIAGTLNGAAYRLGSLAFVRGVARNPGAEVAAADDPSPSAAPQTWLGDANGLVARFVFADTPREDARAVVDGLHAAGIATALLSGDRPAAVASLASVLRIGEARAGLSPADKLAAIARWQAAGEPVLMVGDGINDGPALARADVSATVGGAAALAHGQADVVLAGGRLSDLLALRSTAQAARRVTRQNLVWAAAWNAASVPLALMGLLPPWVAGLGMAASSVLVIGNGLRLLRIGH